MPSSSESSESSSGTSRSGGPANGGGEVLLHEMFEMVAAVAVLVVDQMTGWVVGYDVTGW